MISKLSYFSFALCYLQVDKDPPAGEWEVDEDSYFPDDPVVEPAVGTGGGDPGASESAEAVEVYRYSGSRPSEDAEVEAEGGLGGLIADYSSDED